MGSEASASDVPVGASSATWADYYCFLPKNCYNGHGAVELDHEDINRGASATACAEACNGDDRCAGFVYMGSQRKWGGVARLCCQSARAASGGRRERESYIYIYISIYI